MQQPRISLAVIFTLFPILFFSQAFGTCAVPKNAIEAENCLAGAPQSQWDINEAGDSTIQGFATDISVNRGQTVSFKIKTNATNYRLDIYRMGYYGGNGARLVRTINPSASLPQSQPSCLTDNATMLVDCGNWAVSASWAVPSTATSGIYFAKAIRTDTGGASHIFFIVRDDSSTSDILFRTADASWHAYNDFQGTNLYTGGPGPQGGAYKVSYNRPFHTRVYEFFSWVFSAEYPMVRFLEANGYDVSYFTSLDTARSGSLILQHKALISVGHDEYWSAAERTNVEAARAAGVNLAFFSGNEVFWKTRWEPSIDGSNTPNRTLVCYKETHANAVVDPQDPSTWTGTWRDKRFSPPADGGKPENALTGTLFMMNGPQTPPLSIEVPAADGKMRFWRRTSVAQLSAGQVHSTPAGTLGYEWDVDADNGFRPAGLFGLSTTTFNSSNDYLLDNGSNYGAGTAVHRLTMYRAPSGALVFGAGTVQWSWGLDSHHDGTATTVDPAMQQATVNLFADMGVQPATILSGLVATPASSDTTPPSSTITAPASGTTIQAGSLVTIAGTATDVGGVVGGVEVSVDGGTTWHPASGRENWTYNWQAAANTTATIRSRAVDDSGHIETPSGGITVTVPPRQCPCSIWGTSVTPGTVDAGDPDAVELGFKFRSDVNGSITGIRFYKSAANTGAHVGNLWTTSGTRLASAPFTNETASGWQTVTFASPVPISANTTYIASYFDPNGHYAATDGYFASTGVDNTPLHALADGVDGGNGVYTYSSASTFPASTFSSAHYWVDVVFTTGTGQGATAPNVMSVTPGQGSTGIATNAAVTATFSEAIDPATATNSSFQLLDALNSPVSATVSYVTTQTVSLQPTAPLAASTTYTAVLTGGSGGLKDMDGDPLPANFSWTFTTAAPTAPAGQCPCTLWSSSSVPSQVDSQDGTAGEYGFRFRADVAGTILGIRYYRSAANTGSHTAHLWANDGTLLNSASFVEESGVGWQQANFTSPVSILPNTTYVASYFAPNGHYSANGSFFTQSVNNGPLHALADGADGPTGVYSYGTSSTFPTATFMSANYWVDVIFQPLSTTTPPSVISTVPTSNSTGAGLGSAVKAMFNEPMTASSINATNFVLMDAASSQVPAKVTYDTTTESAVLVPLIELSATTSYTATIKGGATGVHDFNGNALPSDFSWTFVTGTGPASYGPGGPVLVVANALNPFTNYYSEILSAEGFNEYTVIDLANISAATLSSYDVVILGEMALSATQASMFSNWVNSGGKLIAMRPDKQLAGLLGLVPTASTLSNAYILVQTSSGPGAGIVGQSIQFHGTADLYTVSGASTVATLFADASTPTSSPAVTLATAGSGQAAAFTYDLARSVVYTRQGNPAWAGQERDGPDTSSQDGPNRSDDLFFGAASFDPQPDWVNLNKVAIPQADEQQRLLANLILQMNSTNKPLPRFWYFPSGKKAVVVMTGDDHGNDGAGGVTAQRLNDFVAASPAGCSVADWECVRSTSYIFPDIRTGNPFTNAQAGAFAAQGFEIGVHVDSNPTCSNWTTSSLDSAYTNYLGSFAVEFPSVPTPKTHRMHCISWSDYDSQPTVELAHGIRLDTNYYYWPGTWIHNVPGLFTGSGVPMRFADRNGNLIDVYQATTQMPDESELEFPLTIDTLLDNAVGATGYYGAFTTNIHNDANHYPGPANQIVASAQARGVPVISAQQLLTWLDGRNSSSFGSFSWNGSVLSFTVTVGSGARNLQAMLPANSNFGTLSSIKLNGANVVFTTQTIKGIQYAFFSAVAGAYQATYGSGTPQPVANVSPTSLTFTSQQVGTSSAAQSVVLANTGGAALNIGGISITGANAGDFTQTNTCGASLAAGTNCTISVTFAPTASGARSAVLSISDDAAGSPHTASLAGTGTVSTPAVSFSPPSLSFASQLVGATSAAQNITLSNTGSAPLTISGISITGANAGDFTQTNTCGAQVAAGSSCTFSVTFTPGATGGRSATLSISDDAPGSPHTATFTGVGAAPAASLSPVSVTFAAQMLGTTSAAQSVTLSNPGNTSLTISSISITGANAADFTQTSACGGGLAPGASCTINVTFTPAGAGTRSAVLSVSDNAAGSPHTASLAGTGTVGAPGVSLSPSSLMFGSQAVGTASAAQGVLLSNTGNAPLSISSISITGTNAGDFVQTNTCGAGLAAGASCTISVSFKPTAAGSKAATLSVSDNAAGSPHTSSLSGVGAAPAVGLSSTSLAFGNQLINTTSGAQTVTLSNTGTGTLAISSITVTGTNAGNFTRTTTCGTSLAAGANCTISVTFRPTAAGARTAAVTITDNASGSPHTVALTGTGTAPVVGLTPTTLAFGNQAINTTSAARTVTLSNTGTAALTISSIAIGGTNASSFSQTNTCGTSLAAGSSCTISVRFRPTMRLSRTATLSVTDNANGSPHRVSLTGRGI